MGIPGGRSSSSLPQQLSATVARNLAKPVVCHQFAGQRQFNDGERRKDHQTCWKLESRGTSVLSSRWNIRQKRCCHGGQAGYAMSGPREEGTEWDC